MEEETTNAIVLELFVPGAPWMEATAIGEGLIDMSIWMQGESIRALHYLEPNIVWVVDPEKTDPRSYAWALQHADEED